MKTVNYYYSQFEDCVVPFDVSEEDYEELKKGADPNDLITGFYDEIFGVLDKNVNQESDLVFLGEDDKAPLSGKEELMVLKERLGSLISVLDDELTDARTGGSQFELGWYRGAKAMLEKVLGKDIALDEMSCHHSVKEN